MTTEKESEKGIQREYPHSCDDNDELQDMDNKNRNEMLWSNKIEYLFEDWATQSRELSQQHNKAAKHKKCLHRSFGIPAVVIPIAMASVNQLYEKDEYIATIVNSIGYLLVGTLTGINTFINYASQYQRHYNSEIRYKELYIDIRSLLIKSRKDRPPADVSITRYKLIFEHTNEISPDI